MCVESEIRRILDDDSHDIEDGRPCRAELIEQIATAHGWNLVHDYLIKVLTDDNSAYRDWQEAAHVFWGALLDKWPMEENLVIGLVYYRLKPDEGSSVNNLAWSIACNLKGESYMTSDYNPREDPAVIQAMAYMGLAL